MSALKKGTRICLSHPYDISGDVRLHKTVTALKSAGAQVSVVVRDCACKETSAFDGLCEVIRVKNLPFKARASNSRLWFLRVAWNLMVAEPLARLAIRARRDNILYGFAEEMAKHDFDIIHFTDYVSTPELLRAQSIVKAPIVYETYEYSPSVIEAVGSDHADIVRMIKRERAAMNAAAAVIVVGEEIRDRYSDDGVTALMSVVYNVAPEKPMEPTGVEKPIKLYFQSVIRPLYGLEMLIEALSQVNGEWMCTLQGPASYPEYLETIIEKISDAGLEKRMKIEEPVSFTQVVTAANEHDIGLHVIPRSFEGITHLNNTYALPNKLFVYANAGLSMVFGRYEAMKRIIGSVECVAWVDELSREEITATIQELVDNPKRVQAMKENAAQWSKTYNNEYGARQVINVFSSVLE
jgi:glycosyltransferase involved in cell wall biosynthesis